MSANPDKTGMRCLEYHGAISADGRGLPWCREAFKVKGKARFPRKGIHKRSMWILHVSLKSKFKLFDTEAIIFVCNKQSDQAVWLILDDDGHSSQV